MDDREKARRVSEARRLLDEPLLNEALDTIEKKAIEEMLAISDAEAMRRAADRVRTIRDIRHQLKLVIIAGEDALRPNRKVA